jgi:hypothetical protein
MSVSNRDMDCTMFPSALHQTQLANIFILLQIHLLELGPEAKVCILTFNVFGKVSLSSLLLHF